MSSLSNSRIFKDILALISGCLVFLSLAPYNYWGLALFSTVLFIYSLDNNTKNIKRLLFRGYLYGTGLFGCGVSWIYISIHEHGNASPVLAGFLTMLLVLGVLAFYPALKVYLYKKFESIFLSKQSNKFDNVLSIISFSSIWVLVDWLQAWLFTGFPWLFLGYSQINTPLAGYGPILSVYGLTWLVVFSSGLIYLIIQNLKIFINNNHNQHCLNTSLNYALLIIIIFVMGASLGGVQWTTRNNTEENLVLVQGNIAQSNRWRANALEENISTYENLTQPYWKNKTIIWPESALNLALPYSNSIIAKWQSIAINNNSTLILGVPQLAKQIEHGNGIKQSQFFNSIIAIGHGSGIHNKNKLVPFGEYVPFENILRGVIDFFNMPMSNFISDNNKFNTLSSKSIQWLPFICYEIAYPNYVINHADLGDAIITISNDTWFGNSIGPWQHLQLAQMRALETARPVIRATNNGITALIDTKGKIINKIPQFQAGVLTQDNIAGYKGITPIMYYGVNSLIALLFFILSTIGYSCWRVKARDMKPLTRSTEISN